MKFASTVKRISVDNRAARKYWKMMKDPRYRRRDLIMTMFKMMTDIQGKSLTLAVTNLTEI
jgi:hypothetical protein